MSIRHFPVRVALASALAVAVLASSGCHWFHRGGNADYQKSVENRPLEIPPDLDKPAVDASMQIPSGNRGASTITPRSVPPAASTIAPASIAPASIAPVSNSTPTPASAAPAAGSDASFTVTDTPAGTWARMGSALAHIDGVVITQRAQVLSSYEVRYKGATFLLRASAEGSASRVIAIGTDGQVTHSAEANELLGLLQARIG